MIGKMVLDMIYFVVLLLIVLMSYGVARQALLNPNQKPSWRLAKHVFYMPYFMLYGEVFADSIDPECGEGPNQHHCVTGQWINPIIMSIYLLIANVLLLNLLIAVFNNIFVEVNAISQQVWKSQRFRVVMEYEQKPIIPPPLIILSHLYLGAKYSFNYWKGKGELYDGGLKLFLDEASIEKLNDFEEECVDSFFRDKEALVTPDQQLTLLLERMETMTQRIEDINQRQKETNSWIQKLEFELRSVEELSQQTYSALVLQDEAERTSFSLKEDSNKAHSENEDIPSIDVQDEDASIYLQVDKPRDSIDYPSRKISTSSKVSFMCDEDVKKPPASPRISISCSSRPDNQASDDSSGNHLSLFHRRLHRSRSPLLVRQQTIMIPDNVEQEIEGNYSESIPMGKHPPLRRRSVSQVEDEHGPCPQSAPSYRKVGRSLSCHSSSPWFKLDAPARIAPSSPRPPMLGATRGEYTSITDELENVASLNQQMHLQYHHVVASRSNSNEPPKDEVETEMLHDAEETDYLLMTNLIQRRLHRNSENLAASLEELCTVPSDLESNADDSFAEGNELEPLCSQSITVQAHGDDLHPQFWSETRC